MKNNTLLTDIDIELVAARVEDLRSKKDTSPFELTGREIQNYANKQNFSDLPVVLNDFFQKEKLKHDIYKEESLAGTRALSEEEKAKNLGKGFWKTYKGKIRDSICNKNGDLYKLFKREGKTSTKAIIVGLASTLGLGSAFTGILCGLVMILLDIGLDAFCDWTSEDSCDKIKESSPS